MPTQNSALEKKAERKKEPASKPGSTAPGTQRALPGHESFYNLLDSPTPEAQAAMLKQLPTVQAQSAVVEMNQKQGNRHVQQVMAQYQGHREGPPAKSTPPPQVQAKLTVSEPGDSQELEADQMAERMLNMAPPAPPPDDSGPKSHPQGNPSADLKRIRPPAPVQAKGVGGGAVDSGVEDRIASLRGGGEPLPESERAFFEPRLGADLSGVRIHTDSTAVQTSRELQARAYTVGPDIAFNSGEYQPGTTPGRRLLGHELTHVIQQSGGQVSTQREIDPQVQRQEGSEGGVLPGGVEGIETALNSLKEGDGEYSVNDLIAAWESLGRDGLLEVAANNYQLWQDSVAYTLDRLPYIPICYEIREKFEQDVIATVRYYLDQNEGFVQEEMAKVGAGDDAMTPETLEYLCELQMAAQFYLDGLEALRQLNMSFMGLRTYGGGDGGAGGPQVHPIGAPPPGPEHFQPNPDGSLPQGADAAQLAREDILNVSPPVLFEEIGPNSQLPPDIDTTQTDLIPIVPYERVNSQYVALFSLMTALGEAYPSIYVMLREGTLDEFAEVPINPEDHTVDPDGAPEFSIEAPPQNDANPELAQGIVMDALDETMKNISGTRAKLGSELTFRDFGLIHQQLLAGEAPATGLTDWSSGNRLAHEIGTEVAGEGEGMSFWEVLGLTATAAGFALVVFASGGLALAGSAIMAATVVPSLLQARESVEHYQAIADASEINVRDSLAIVTEQQVSEAKLKAAIDVACFALDFAGALGDIAHAARASRRLIARLGGIDQVRVLIGQSGGLDSFLVLLQRTGGADEFIVLLDNLGDFNAVLSTINALGPENFGALMTHCKGARGFVNLLRQFDNGAEGVAAAISRMAGLGEGMDFFSVLGRFSNVDQFLVVAGRFSGDYEAMARALVRFDSVGDFIAALDRFDTAGEFIRLLERFDDVDQFITTVNRLSGQLDRLMAILDQVPDIQQLVAGISKVGTPQEFFDLLATFDNRVADFLTSLDRFTNFRDFRDTLNYFSNGGLSIDDYLGALSRFSDASDFATTLARFSDASSGAVDTALFLQTLNRFAGNTPAFVRAVELFGPRVGRIGAALDSFGGNADEMLRAMELLSGSDIVTAGGQTFHFGSYAAELLPLIHSADEAQRLLALARDSGARGLMELTDELRRVVEASDINALPDNLKPMFQRWRNFGRAFTTDADAQAAVQAIQQLYGTPRFADPANLMNYISGNNLEVTLIGALTDTTAAAGAGARTLMIPNWSMALNFQYIQDVIDRRQIFRLSTELTPDALLRAGSEHRVSIFLRELELIRDAGFVRIGDCLVPPEVARAAGYIR